MKIRSLLVAGFLILSCFFSCRTAREQSKKYLDKALVKDRPFVIDTLRKIYPCIDGKVIPGDSVAYKKWKNAFDSLLNQPIDPPPAIHDTLLKMDSIKCPDQQTMLQYYKKQFNKSTSIIQSLRDSIRSLPAIHDTLPVKDSSDDYMWNVVVQGKDMEIKDAVAATAKQSKKKDFWFAWAMISSGLFLVSVIVIVIKSKTKLLGT